VTPVHFVKKVLESGNSCVWMCWINEQQGWHSWT